MKLSKLQILCGSAAAVLLAVGPVSVADAHAGPTVLRPTAAGGDPCNGDPNCSSGGATSPSGGPYQGSQPSGGQPSSPPPSGGQPSGGQPSSPPPSGSNGSSGQPSSPPPSNGGTGSGSAGGG